MSSGKIRCDECVYWGNPRPDKINPGAMGDCHFSPPHNEDRFVPGFAIWPVTTEDDWCGQFKHPEIVEKETVEAERVIRGNQCNHEWPIIGCSKCMNLVAYAMPVDPESQVKRYKVVGDTVQKPSPPPPPSPPTPQLCPNCLGKGCIACLPDNGPLPNTGHKRTSCLCGGVGCSSCEPGGRG